VILDAVPAEFMSTGIKKSNIVFELHVHANTTFKPTLSLVLRPLVLRWGLFVEHPQRPCSIKVTCATVFFQRMAGTTIRNDPPIIFLNVLETCGTWMKLL
jgi:hypothetical protein